MKQVKLIHKNGTFQGEYSKELSQIANISLDFLKRIKPELVDLGFDMDTLVLQFNDSIPRKNLIINHNLQYFTSYYGTLPYENDYDVVVQYPYRDSKHLMSKFFDFFSVLCDYFPDLNKHSFYFRVKLKNVVKTFIYPELINHDFKKMKKILKSNKEYSFFAFERMCFYEFYKEDDIIKFFKNIDNINIILKDDNFINSLSKNIYKNNINIVNFLLNYIDNNEHNFKKLFISILKHFSPNEKHIEHSSFIKSIQNYKKTNLWKSNINLDSNLDFIKLQLKEYPRNYELVLNTINIDNF